MTGCNCNSSSCSCSCDITSLPTGADGLNGYNAYTQSTSKFIVPAIGSNNTIDVSNLAQYTGEWAATYQVIFIEGAGYYQVITEGTTSLEVKNLGYPGNALVGSDVPAGARVCPAGLIGLPGNNGISLVWLGSFATAPTSPSLNNAYYNTTDGKSYVWNGTTWDIIAQDGATGPTGATGPIGPPGPTGASGGLLDQNFYIPGTTTRFFETTGISYGNVLTFLYRGSSNTKTPVNIKIVAKDTTAAGSGEITITDITNGLDWISPFFFTPGTTEAIIDLGTPTNIPTGPAIIRVGISGVLGGHTITVYSMTITYA